MSEDVDARRTRLLVERRRATSKAKRTEALKACRRLAEQAIPITFASVAREADVSTWLLYNVPELKTAVISAQRRQRSAGKKAKQAAPEGPSDDSLKTDLALARVELQALRAKNEQLDQRLELQLGAEIEGTNAQDLLDRIRELETVNETLRRDRDNVLQTAKHSGSRIEELEAELAEKGDLVRSMLFARNT